jgi:hypothetical protein
MQHTKLLACASGAVLALALACSKDSPAPVAPTGAEPGVADAANDGSTLKATAPTPQSPVNNAQPDVLILTAGASTARFVSGVVFSYLFEVRNAANAVVCTSGAVAGTATGVSWTPSCTLEFDVTHSWRVRATHQGAVGPWSAAATFRAPAGGFIRGNEVFDPLTNGRTVGQAHGGVTFISGTGARLNSHESRITYELPTNLQSGEFSLMVTGIDEGSPGDKTKVMSMQEGHGELTDNDYRFTAEKRGRSYSTPGATTWRIIMGEADEHAGRIFDGDRFAPAAGYSDERWYFWRFTWASPGRAELTVRADGPRGPVIYQTSRGTGGFLYRPVPHVIHLGASVGRAGVIDASIPGATYKNVWVSSAPRPAFPGE